MARVTKQEQAQKKAKVELNDVQPTEEEFEEEFHTEESDNDSIEGDLERDENEPVSGEEDSENEDDEENLSASKSSVPLLPEHLLKSTPKAATRHSASPERTTRAGRTLRPRSKQAKKQLWDQLQVDAKGTGVIEAGKAAQKKRNVPSRNRQDRVRAGRVGKKSKAPPRSGKQQLLDQRKVQVKRR